MPLSLERLRRQAWVRGADERAQRALTRDRTSRPPRAAEEDLDLSMVREIGPSAPASSLGRFLEDFNEVI